MSPDAVTKLTRDTNTCHDDLPAFISAIAFVGPCGFNGIVTFSNVESNAKLAIENLGLRPGKSLNLLFVTFSDTFAPTYRHCLTVLGDTLKFFATFETEPLAKNMSAIAELLSLCILRCPCFRFTIVNLVRLFLQERVLNSKKRPLRTAFMFNSLTAMTAVVTFASFSL